MQKVIFIENPDNYYNLCSGCRLCELICAFEHYKTGNARLAFIKVINGEKGLKVPVVCQQCQEPVCAVACPTGALYREKADSAVTVDQHKCIGCGLCANVCPVGGISISIKDGKAAKCDLCKGDPQCVKYCPSKVLKYSEVQELSYTKQKRYALKLSEAGETVKGKER